MEEKRKVVLQWHPASYADMQIELAEEADKLLFQNEYLLGKKPMQVDMLVRKKRADEKIHKNIGRIFRTYNLIEYKSPKDYLAIDDFYKVYGYACFYKSDTGKENEIPAEELTITFISKSYSRKMIRHLEDVQKYTIEKAEAGIYYVHGDVMGIQIIVTSQLTPEKNLWLYGLTDELEDSKVVKKLLNEYRGKLKDDLYSAVMQVIVIANKEKFREVDEGMCDALLEVIDEHKERLISKGREEGIQEGLQLGREEGREEGIQEGRAEMGISLIRNVIETMKVTVDRAMDILKILPEEREMYRKML